MVMRIGLLRKVIGKIMETVAMVAVNRGMMVQQRGVLGGGLQVRVVGKVPAERVGDMVIGGAGVRGGHLGGIIEIIGQIPMGVGRREQKA